MNRNNPDDPIFGMLVAYYNRAGINIPTPVEPNTRQDELILTLLERLNDEPACEFEHVKSDCEAHVTHRARSCSDALNLCATAAGHVKKVMENPWSDCDQCQRPAADCWKIHAA